MPAASPPTSATPPPAAEVAVDVTATPSAALEFAGPVSAPPTTAPAGETVDEIVGEISQETPRSPGGQRHPTTVEQRKVNIPRAASATTTGLPHLDVDVDDVTAMMVTPTVLSIPSSILRRFEEARKRSASHTALVLDALRGHVQDLPSLVVALRPGPRAGDLFPYRATPGAAQKDTPGPLRIRPTAGELAVMDAITTWVNTEIKKARPGSRRVTRSEVVAVALDAFLPGRRR
jgi:hypothetical protein